jgi:hypothetical protein
MKIIARYTIAALFLAPAGSALAQTVVTTPAPPPAYSAPSPYTGYTGTGGRALTGNDDVPVQGNVAPTQEYPLERVPNVSSPGPLPPSGETSVPAISNPSPN